MRLKLLLDRIAGGWPAGDTLDWGCGCGRVTRWLLDRLDAGVRVVGADIDPLSIHWCRQNLAGGFFERIPLHPPTTFRDEQFSVVLGISVFTHLKEDVQFEWLSELR